MLITKNTQYKNKHNNKFFWGDVLLYIVDLFIHLIQNIILIASFVIKSWNSSIVSPERKFDSFMLRVYRDCMYAAIQKLYNIVRYTKYKLNSKLLCSVDDNPYNKKLTDIVACRSSLQCVNGSGEILFGSHQKRLVQDVQKHLWRHDLYILTSIQFCRIVNKAAVKGFRLFPDNSNMSLVVVLLCS